MNPYVGAHVLYKLAEGDAEQINRRRADADAHRRRNHDLGTSGIPGDTGRTGHVLHVGNTVSKGDAFPAVITSVCVAGTATLTGTVNLKVHLDGNDDYWATSRPLDDGPGTWQWPPCESASAEAVMEFTPLTVSNAATHWRDEGAVAIEPGIVTIVEGDGDWAGPLSELPGVTAIRLDGQHVALMVREAAQ